MVNEMLALLGLEIGAGGVSGFLVGYGFKQIAKLLLIVGSVLSVMFMLPLAYLMNLGIVTVNWSELYAILETATTQTLTGLSTILVQWSALGGSFAVGFTAGLTKG